jgi:hypothetical protein
MRLAMVRLPVRTSTTLFQLERADEARRAWGGSKKRRIECHK